MKFWRVETLVPAQLNCRNIYYSSIAGPVASFVICVMQIVRSFSICSYSLFFSCLFSFWELSDLKKHQWRRINLSHWLIVQNINSLSLLLKLSRALKIVPPNIWRKTHRDTFVTEGNHLKVMMGQSLHSRLFFRMFSPLIIYLIKKPAR